MTVLSVVSLLCFIIFTNPSDLPLPLLMVPALMVFVSGYLVSFAALSMLPNYPITKKKRRVIALASATLPTLLLVLQTLQQLLVRDILIVGGLWLLLIWYLQRIDFA